MALGMTPRRAPSAAARRIAWAVGFSVWLVVAAAWPLLNPPPVGAIHSGQPLVDGSEFTADATTADGVLWPGNWTNVAGTGDGGLNVNATTHPSGVYSPCYSFVELSSADIHLNVWRNATGGTVKSYACTDGTPTRLVESNTASNGGFVARVFLVVLAGAENGMALYFDRMNYDDVSIYGLEPAAPTPTPSPTPAPTPTPGPTEPPGPFSPTYQNRNAALVDRTVIDLALRCRDQSVALREASIEDEEGGIVVSCQETPGSVDTWGGDVPSDDLTDGDETVNGGYGFYIGYMQEGGPFTVTGHTRPRADDPWQTWCWPETYLTADCEAGTQDGLTAAYGASATGQDGLNYPPHRERVRAALVASVVDEDGQRDYQCTAWASMRGRVALFGTYEFSARDAWDCPIPANTYGDVYLRVVSYSHEDRFNEPRPFPSAVNQSYMTQIGYAVLTSQGHWVYSLVAGPGPDTEWPWCADAVGDAPCEFEPEGRETSGSWDAPAAFAPGVDSIPTECVDASGASCSDSSAGVCPITGEFKPGCAPLPDCDGLDVGCAVNNVAVQMLGYLIDLFMPGPNLGASWADLLETGGTRVPFGWFAQVTDATSESLAAPADTLGAFNLTVGSATVSIGASMETALEAMVPFRGLLVAGVTLIMLLSILRWIMAAVGVSPSKPAEGGEA